MTDFVTHDGGTAFAQQVCLCHCGADAIGTDDEGRWSCGRHIESPDGGTTEIALQPGPP